MFKLAATSWIFLFFVLGSKYVRCQSSTVESGTNGIEWLASNVDTGMECPRKELIEPCTCLGGWAGGEDDVSLRCEGISEPHVIIDVLDKSRDMEFPFNSFHLDSSTVLYIPVSVFNLKRLAEIIVKHSTISSLFESPPPKDNVLDNLDIHDVTIISGEIEWEQMSTLRKLNRLGISNTPIKKLGTEFRDNLPENLEMLVLEENGLEQIDDFAFSRLLKLTNLNIEHQKLKEIKRSMFAVSAKLRFLRLTFNEIESLPSDIFTNMPDLRSVSLSFNRITMLPEEVYGQLKTSQSVFLEDNPIQCKCYLRWYAQLAHNEKRVYADCAEPEELGGRDIKTLTLRDFSHCP